MRVEPQAGYVLHTRPYRDSSLLVEFFSRDYGRVSLVAKGAKGRKTRGGSRAALLQLFQPLACAWSGRGELKTLIDCESCATLTALPGRSMFSGLYVNELLVRLLHHEDPHQALYDRYARVLTELRADGSDEICLRQFELSLLEELGYGFALDLDGQTGAPVVADCRYHYYPEYGLSLASQEVNEQLPSYLGAELRAIAHGDYSGNARRCAKALMRQVLATHLGEKPLRSRELFYRY